MADHCGDCPCQVGHELRIVKAELEALKRQVKPLRPPAKTSTYDRVRRLLRRSQTQR